MCEKGHPDRYMFYYTDDVSVCVRCENDRLRAELKEKDLLLIRSFEEQDVLKQELANVRAELADATFIKDQMTDMANGQRIRAEKAEEELTTCRAELEEAIQWKASAHELGMKLAAKQRAFELACEELMEYKRRPTDSNFKPIEFTDYFRRKARGK